MAEKSEFEKLLDTRTGLLLFVGTLLFLINAHVAGVIGFVMLFTAFDVIGFYYVDEKRGSAGYRIVQVMFQAALTYVLAEHVGLVAAIGATIAWYLLACDVLFYWALGIELSPFNWFGASPVVFIFQRLLKQPSAPAWSVLLSSIVGILLAILLPFII
jgi:hypothetical protein